MRFRHVKSALGFVLIAVAVVGAALALSNVVRDHDGDEAQAEAEFPTALGRHLEALKEALPGNQGMAEDGPSSAAEADFLERAFPADTISVAQMNASRLVQARRSTRTIPSETRSFTSPPAMSPADGPRRSPWRRPACPAIVSPT